MISGNKSKLNSRLIKEPGKKDWSVSMTIKNIRGDIWH